VAARRPLFTSSFLRIWWVSFSGATAGFLLFPSAPFRLRDLAAPPEAVGWFLGGLTYGSALAAAWTGALADLVGRRRMLLGAGALLAALAASYAWVADWRLLVLLSLPNGVVWSALLTSGNSEMLRIVPPERRAEGIAYYGLATNLAIALAPATGIWLLERSWPALCATIAALWAGVALLAARLEPDLPVAADVWARLAPQRAIDFRTLRVAGALLLGSFGYGGVTSFVALFAEERGIAPKGIFFTAFAVTIFALRPAIAPLIDRWGPRRALPVGLVVVALGLAATALPRARWELVCAAVIYGFGFSILGPAFTAWSIDNVDPGRRGAAFGALLAAFDLGIGSGSLLMGTLVARAGFPAAFLVSAALALGAWPYLLWAEKRSGFVAHRPEVRL
jgi:MFS family permease